MNANLDERARACADSGADAMEHRLFRMMRWAVVLSTLASAAFAPWRVTTGLALGGALALLNHHWLRTSIRAAFSSANMTGVRPKLSAARFVLRYFIVAASVFAASELGVVSVVATLAGLSVFVVAALVEGFFQTFLTFVQREEN